MKKKNLPMTDNRGFFARLAVLLAPQDELVAYRAREIVKKQDSSREKLKASARAPKRSARFLGFI